MSYNPITTFQIWADNARNNLGNTVRSLTPVDYIRLVAIVGGYALLRPYLIRLGGRFQAKDHEREIVDSQGLLASGGEGDGGSQGKAGLNGQVGVPEDTDDEDDDDPAHTTNWGRTARRRQRKMIKKILEAEETKLRKEQEDEEDKDIEEFLT
ncbi:MAG: hypothetical protein M1825_000196 [Sarcosagium campestre]|nr:MAG: hypothetical protein M1825_000196 [Sarcosagium campestre]